MDELRVYSFESGSDNPAAAFNIAPADPQILLPNLMEIANASLIETIQVEIINTGASQDLTITDAFTSGTDASGLTVLTDFTSPLVIGPSLSAMIDIEVDPANLPLGSRINAFLEVVSDGMESPNSGLQEGAFFFRGARFSDKRIIENSVAAIEPAVVSP